MSSMIKSFSGCVAVGDIIADRYRVDAILGKGGMGVVVAATQIDLLVPRAIKVMHPIYIKERKVVERFVWEARAAARLHNEHVVAVHDFGRLPSGVPFIVMDLLQGQDFSAICESRGRLGVGEAVLYVLQAAEAIRQAHEAGIVHRDIKPANLFLTHRPDGSPCVKVLDFGISKHDDAEDLDLTRAGEMLGSPPYMSPEQIRSTSSVDSRTDVWALGAILYKLLTGRTPFHAVTIPRVILSILDEKPVKPPSVLRPSLPPALDAIIVRCLEKDPDRRMPSVSALMDALRAFTCGAAEAPVTLSEPPPPWSQGPRSHPPMALDWDCSDTAARALRTLEETQPAHVKAMLQSLRQLTPVAGEDKVPSSRTGPASSRPRGSSSAPSLSP
jgi:serine/threonine-protein kinase